MITTADTTDFDIKNDVLAELAYVPGSIFDDVRVAVQDGQVTL
jgi:hypothetical protein